MQPTAICASLSGVRRGNRICKLITKQKLNIMIEEMLKEFNRGWTSTNVVDVNRYNVINGELVERDDFREKVRQKRIYAEEKYIEKLKGREEDLLNQLDATRESIETHKNILRDI